MRCKGFSTGEGCSPNGADGSMTLEHFTLMITACTASLLGTDAQCTVSSCSLPEANPICKRENVCLHIANKFLNTDDM